jgi:3,4-dihydroxy-2-butanone 4-phosphate synthase
MSVHSGYVCIALPENRLQELNISMMVPDNQDRHRTAYTITVDYKHGMSFPYSDFAQKYNVVRDHDWHFRT